MAKRTGGFIGQDGLNAPDQATGVTGTAGNEQVTVSWTAPSDVGGAEITGYSVQSNDGSGEFSPLSLVAFADKTLDYSSQASSAWGFALGDSGTKAYVLDVNSVIYQYTLSTAYDLSTASYASKSEDISGTVTTNPRDITFKPDGTKFYVSADDTDDRIFQFSLSTAWDITTSSYDSLFFDIDGQDTTLYGFTFNSDGTKIVAAGSSNDTLFQYSLSTAYNISTASYDSVSFDVGAKLSEGAPLDVSYNSDGTVLYLAGNVGKKVYRINLSTAYDLSTASYDDEFFATNTSGNTAPYGLFVKPDEQSFFVLDFTDDLIYQYDEGEYPTESPVTITGLTNGTSYTFNVWAINPLGWSSPSDASGGVSPYAPRALFAAGNTGSMSNVIDTVVITTLGNASDFGDLNYSAQNTYACSSVTRGIVAGGALPSPSVNNISYVTIGSTGSASDFGDLNNANTAGAGLSNSTRGIFAGGSTYRADIYYITIASTGNSSTFGSLNPAAENTASCASSTRGVWAGGNPNTGNNTISYVTIASTGDASDFGDLIVGRTEAGGASSATRALFGGAYSGDYRSIEYVTIASTGNAADFGELTYDARGNRGTSSSTRALFMGGLSSNNIDYVTISTSGNAADFGDMTISAYNRSALSNDHGGLQ